MVRTIKEIHDLIKQKKENAEIDLTKSQYSNMVFPCPERISSLQGEIAAYNDVLILIETSHLLEGKNEGN